MAGQIMAHAFNDELEKIAVDAEELLLKTVAAPNVVAVFDPEKPAYSYPSRGRWKKELNVNLKNVGRNYENQASYISKIPFFGKSLSDRIIDRVKRMRAIAREKGLLNIKQNAGKIGIDHRALVARLGAHASTDKPLSEAGKRALVGAIVSHELAERKVPWRGYAPVYSHASPDVLLKEHNTISRLTGDGADEARDIMRNMRKNTGESAYLGRLIGAAIPDPRAQQFLAEGEKVPKAMRKRILQKIRENPRIVNQPEPVSVRLARLPAYKKAQRKAAEAIANYVKSLK